MIRAILRSPLVQDIANAFAVLVFIAMLAPWCVALAQAGITKAEYRTICGRDAETGAKIS